MEKFEAILKMLEYSLNTKRKRHVAGGILVSAALLCGGLAITVLAIQKEENEHE